MESAPVPMNAWAGEGRFTRFTTRRTGESNTSIEQREKRLKERCTFFFTQSLRMTQDASSVPLPEPATKKLRTNSPPPSTAPASMADSTTASSSTPVYSPTAFLVQCDPEHPNAKLPTRGSALAAGYDLYASETVTLPKEGGRKVVQTGIRMKLPEGCYGRVAPRSGLGW